MAFVEISHAAIDKLKETTSAGAMVYLALLSKMGDDGICTVRLFDLAGKAGVTERCARIALRDLERLGFIETRRHSGMRGTNIPNSYRRLTV